MRRCPVNSSDLALANSLSRRLSTGAEATGSRGTDLGYLSLPQQEVTGRVPSRTPSVMPTELPAGPLELDSWEVFLAWSLELCRARAAFVVDAQGFVIASRGNVPREGFDGPGAELCFAMDQMDRLDPEGGSLDALELHFKGRTIVAVKARRDDPSEAYVIAFVGSRPLSEEIRDALLRQLSYSLPVLS